MKVCLIALTVFLSLQFFAEAQNSLKKEFLKRFPMKEGHYNVLPPDNQNWDYCQDEELDIDLYDVGGEMILTIGPRLVFPDLQAKQTTSTLEKGCEVRTTNQFANNTLEQTVVQTCGKKLDYKKVHFLQVEGDVLNYRFSTQGQTQTCKYKLLNAKEAK